MNLNEDRNALIASVLERLPRKDRGRGLFFGDKDETEKYLSQGYEPVKGKGGKQIEHAGDPLFLKPKT